MLLGTIYHKEKNDQSSSCSRLASILSALMYVCLLSLDPNLSIISSSVDSSGNKVISGSYQTFSNCSIRNQCPTPWVYTPLSWGWVALGWQLFKEEPRTPRRKSGTRCMERHPCCSYPHEGSPRPKVRKRSESNARIGPSMLISVKSYVVF